MSFCSHHQYALKYVITVTEICGPKYRTYFGILTQFPFGIGAALLPLIAYFIRDWQNLQLAISLPCVLLALYYWYAEIFLF